MLRLSTFIKITIIQAVCLIFLGLVTANPVLADHCGSLSFCEACVASHCGWGGATGDINCKDIGSHAYSCPATNYSIWWTLSGQCAQSSANRCINNTTTAPPPCSQFNNNCSQCIQQSACGFDGTNCINVDASIGNVCPAGKTRWNWSDCNVNECTTTGGSSGGTGGTSCPGNYIVSGRVTNSGVGVSGVTVCIDPTASGCASVTKKTTTNGNGDYSISGVSAGGNGHTVYVEPDNIVVQNNQQTISGTQCGSAQRNFTLAPSGTRGYNVEYEQCIDGVWQSMGTRCSNACGTPGTTCSPNPPYYCSAGTTGLPFGGAGCSLNNSRSCSGTNSCYYCIPPTTTPPGTPPPPPAPNSCGNGVCNNQNETCLNCPQDCGQCTQIKPFIQTSEGDVHSNTRIDAE